MRVVKLLCMLMVCSPIYSSAKTAKQAIFLSLLLPGVGEQYLGDKVGALRGYVTEISLWLSYFGFTKYGRIIRHNYQLFAHQYAGASLGMDEDYYFAVEWYRDIEAYNRHIREEARMYYDDRDKQLEYIENHSLPEDVAWSWQDDTVWERFRHLRTDERKMYQFASMALGGLVINRIISAFWIYYRAPRFLVLEFRSLPRGGMLTLSWQFR